MIKTADGAPSVWEDISSSPAEAELLRVRSDAMTALRTTLASRGWTDVECARNLGLTLPQIRDLRCGRLHAFSLEDLVRAAASAGLHAHVRMEG
ncbi:helix-turn-helix domain-containing protein [Prescottella equi]|uniref:helix-turn-helix domain-containing protein n=1 Tax=Rhodococcus hoagii TaxID=43767 RepID=UPI001C74FC37|nr:XRE family transcriptional regulator [Prescottella equi]BCN44714.1 hypothetical protein RE9414_29940 [Prescottella equi]